MPRTTTKVCTVCGASFVGAFRAKYCPECRIDKKKQYAAECQKRRSSGTVRRIGSTDLCRQCGGTYTVKSGMQQYCPACADSRHRERNAHLMDYYHARRNREKDLPDTELRDIRAAAASYQRSYYQRRMEQDPDYRRKRAAITKANKDNHIKEEHTMPNTYYIANAEQETTDEDSSIQLTDVIGAVYTPGLHSEDRILSDGSLATEFRTYRLTHVLSDRLVIVSIYDGGYDDDELELERDCLLWHYSDGWYEIYTSRRHHSVIEELRDGSAYADLSIGDHGSFASQIRSIVDASGILNA